MKIELESVPSFGMAVVTLEAGESIQAESGSMVAMSSGIAVKTTFNGTGGGDFLDWVQAAVVGLARKFLAGETLFVNVFKATAAGQTVMLAPAMVGDVRAFAMGGGRKVVVQATSYLASSPGVTVDLVWGGFSMLFGGGGAFFLACNGTGDLLINAYGAIEEVEIDGDYVVDSGHVVAFEGALRHRLKRVGGWKSTFLSGEGLVLEFSGRGKVWLQTRNLGALVTWITPSFPR